jgi:hypothetical protein
LEKARSSPLAFDPADMALRGRIGALRLHATHDPRETTSAARATFLARFERDVDPEGLLPEGERRRRAEYARKAHFATLALKPARTRSRNATKKNTSAVDETAEVLSLEVQRASATPS